MSQESGKWIPNTFYDEATKELRRESAEHRRNLAVLTIARAAERDGAAVAWFSRNYLWATLPDRTVPLYSHFGAESVVGSALSTNKDLTRQLLIAAGVSVPRGRIVDTPEEAIATQKSFGTPVVLKPLGGSMGNGVTVDLTDPDEIREAFAEALKYGRAVLLEQFIVGSEYRIHATERACTGAFERLLPNVIGDGKTSLKGLVEVKNERRRQHPAAKTPIPMDYIATRYLQRAGLSWETIPQEGERVVVRDINGLTSGGDALACFDELDEKTKQTAVDAIAAIPGMHWGGVDLLIDDRTGEPYVIEVNTDASIFGSAFPVFGPPRDVGGELWLALKQVTTPEPSALPQALSYDSGAPSRLPVHEGARALPIGELVRGEVEKQGRKVEKINRSIWNATTSDGDVEWFVGPMTAKDRRVAMQVLRQRGMLHWALSRKQIPYPRGRRVRTPGGIYSFRSRMRGPVSLLPALKHGSSGTIIRVDVDGSVPAEVWSSRPAWYVQERPSGTRFRVIATPERALVAIVGAGVDAPSEDSLHRGTLLAVRAVRALPQLRWAVVDVCVGEMPSDEVVADAPSEERPTAWVEEVSHRPTFRPDDVVVAGSMQAYFDYVLG